MGEFWVYENWTVHVATLHRGDCRSCSHGAGQSGGGETRNGKWHGRYDSQEAARLAPLKPRSMLRDCASCME
jgi:hypothetical protein